MLFLGGGFLVLLAGTENKKEKHACKGQNSCKGQGFKEMSKADCEKAKADMSKAK